MNRRTVLGFALAALLTLPQWSHAQDSKMPEMGPLSSVMTWDVEPADMQKFLGAVEKVVTAAREANLAPEYGWTMWQKNFSFTIVGPFNRAELDDPEIWMKQFAGTPGEATLAAAFQEFDDVSITRSVTEVHQEMPAWNYMPDGMTMPPMAWARVHEFWTKSSQAANQEWNALIGDIMGFFKEIRFPYPVWGNTVRFGDNRSIFVTAFADPAQYLGANSVDQLAAKAGKTEQWQALMGRLSQVVRRSDSGDYRFMPNHSYMPQAAETGGQ